MSDKMNSFQKFVTLFFPSRDVKILELRKIIKDQKEGYRVESKNLKKEIRDLKEKIEHIDKDKEINIEFYDDNIEEAIIKNLKQVQREICIAMAWLTSENIMKVLGKLQLNNINIKIIIDNNDKNKKMRLWQPCTEMKIADISNPNSKYKNFMHNKYCVIDKKTVIDGSYNWSKNAKYNLEHIIVINNKDVAKLYLDSFYKIYNNPRYFANYTIA